LTTSASAADPIGVAPHGLLRMPCGSGQRCGGSTVVASTVVALASTVVAALWWPALWWLWPALWWAALWWQHPLGCRNSLLATRTCRGDNGPAVQRLTGLPVWCAGLFGRHDRCSRHRAGECVHLKGSRGSLCLRHNGVQCAS